MLARQIRQVTSGTAVPTKLSELLLDIISTRGRSDLEIAVIILLRVRLHHLASDLAPTGAYFGF